jgi:hypothetical protein
MSQHVHGNMSQTVANDYGEFLTSGNLRVRKELIKAYLIHFDSEKNVHTGVKFLIDHGWILADFDDEGSKKEILRLDWLFKKDRHLGEKNDSDAGL